MRGGAKGESSGIQNQPVDMICTTTGKVIYQSSKDANQAGVRFSRRKHSQSNRSMGKLQAYSCTGCDGWHLGNMLGKGNKGNGRSHTRWDKKQAPHRKRRR